MGEQRTPGGDAADGQHDRPLSIAEALALGGSGFDEDAPDAHNDRSDGPRQRFVPMSAVIAAMAGAARVDLKRLRADLDALADQDPTPRG